MPPAMIALILSDDKPKVGGISEASRTQSLPLDPAPTRKMFPPDFIVAVIFSTASSIWGN